MNWNICLYCCWFGVVFGICGVVYSRCSRGSGLNGCLVGICSGMFSWLVC